jgi:glutamate N-acetyltransferase/amino-acid N-acetyltransferase
MTKGSGMIQPNMATTLGYIMTDAELPPDVLGPMLKRATNLSYNRLTVDGDTSTNDTVVLLANGGSGVKPRKSEVAELEAALVRVMQSLAAQIARDGEGAKKLIRVLVNGARKESDAEKIGRAIANSPLVKTAIAGSDPNWGRILAAAGYSGAHFEPAKVDIYLQGKRVCKKGLAAPMDEKEMTKALRAKDVIIDFRISGPGKGRAEFWTCDLTEGYIEINGSYRT